MSLLMRSIATYYPLRAGFAGALLTGSLLTAGCSADSVPRDQSPQPGLRLVADAEPTRGLPAALRSRPADRGEAEARWSFELAMTFYTRRFGQLKPAPKFVWLGIGHTVAKPSACRPKDVAPGPSRQFRYCNADGGLYIGAEAYADIRDGKPYGGAGLLMPVAIAHEMFHHLQHIGGAEPLYRTGEDLKAAELQADCASGAFERWAEAVGVLNSGAYGHAEAMYATATRPPPWIKDPASTGVDPLDHGTVNQRLQALAAGRAEGLTACNTFGVKLIIAAK
jgi:hypothetical protein